MQFGAYRKEIKDNLPPNLDIGTTLKSIVRVEKNTFKLNDKDTEGMRVFAIDITGKEREYRTSSGVLMKQLTEFFAAHPNESLDNVKVVQPRGKQYLTLEEA